MRLSVIMTPKCTGSMPTFTITGIRTGTRMLIDAIGSRKQPTTSKQDVGQQQNNVTVIGQGEQRLGGVFGDAGRRQHPAEQRGRADDQQHAGGRLDRFHRDLVELLRRQRAIEKDAKHDRPGAGRDRRFGWREPAERHAADDDRRRQQGRESREEGQWRACAS